MRPLLLLLPLLTLPALAACVRAGDRDRGDLIGPKFGNPERTIDTTVGFAGNGFDAGAPTEQERIDTANDAVRAQTQAYDAGPLERFGRPAFNRSAASEADFGLSTNRVGAATR